MKIIPEEAHYRQRMMNYRKSHTVVETSMRFRTSEKTVKKWWKRWDGTVNSLINQSRRPKTRPRKTSEEMLKHMRRVLKKHRWEDLLLAYQELIERWGYEGSYGGFKGIAGKLKGLKKAK